MTRSNPLGKAAILVLALVCGCWTLAVDARVAQDPPPADKKEQTQQDKQAEKATDPNPAARLTITVTGGDSDKPVENASVYLKTLQQGLLKDKTFEVNVKTNMQGNAHVPNAPLGRVLIQVVASGWKTYGHWYDVTDPKQVIKVHLERPPKWY